MSFCLTTICSASQHRSTCMGLQGMCFYISTQSLCPVLVSHGHVFLSHTRVCLTAVSEPQDRVTCSDYSVKWFHFSTQSLCPVCACVSRPRFPVSHSGVSVSQRCARSRRTVSRVLTTVSSGSISAHRACVRCVLVSHGHVFLSHTRVFLSHSDVLGAAGPWHVFGLQCQVVPFQHTGIVSGACVSRPRFPVSHSGVSVSQRWLGAAGPWHVFGLQCQVVLQQHGVTLHALLVWRMWRKRKQVRLRGAVQTGMCRRHRTW